MKRERAKGKVRKVMQYMEILTLLAKVGMWEGKREKKKRDRTETHMSNQINTT